LRRINILIFAVLLLILCGRTDGQEAGAPFPPLFAEARPFLSAIKNTRGAPLTAKITGLTVPHHLLAADLLAEAFARVSTQGYRRIIILSPDHFARSRTPFAVAWRDFETCLGLLQVDQAAVQRLLENREVSISNLFSHEHGVQALLPFVAYYFPKAQVVALVLRISATPAQWDSLAQSLAPLLDSRTLLVQSTDFSHYLPLAAARRKDQETLRVLSVGDAEGVKDLSEPGHLDSRAAQYLQLRLQKEIFQARPTVIANRNSQEYTHEALNKTTSYIVQLYSQEPLPVEGSDTWFFAGDTFFGRYMAKVLATRERREALVQEILKITRGARLIVNLEGVLQKKCPLETHPFKLCMEDRVTLGILRRLNTRVVSLANNHSGDYGDDAYREMKRLLTCHGIKVLENRSIMNLGRFRLAAFTDVDNRQQPIAPRLSEKDLECLHRVNPGKPLFALVHWGQEFASTPAPREQLVAARLADKGVELIIGSHSHRASPLTGTKYFCQVFSLGNFIFDQRRPEVSGALLEVTFFPMGTYFLRLHPMGNLYVKSTSR
jgi:poly-gamma-glutamate synthesis protein (capsule biosynthesis protein)